MINTENDEMLMLRQDCSLSKNGIGKFPTIFSLNLVSIASAMLGNKLSEVSLDSPPTKKLVKLLH